MKKTTLSLAAFFFTLMSLRAQIVITEIMYNPPPSGVDSLEYVEVFNNSGMPVNLSGWNLRKALPLLLPTAPSFLPADTW